MSGYGRQGNGNGQGTGSLTPSRRAPPIPASNASFNSSNSASSNPASSFASRPQDSFVPPLASYASSSNANSAGGPPDMNRMNSGGLPMGQGGGAGGGSYTGSLRPAGPGAVVNSPSAASPWSGSGGNSGPGAATAGGGAAGGIVRKGYVSVKEDGIRSWIWSKRWLALREQTLTFHKNEVSN